jgi:DNA end-binding protein Ku
MAEQLIDSLTSTWDPDRYHDTYREQVLDILNRKAEGEEIVVRKSTEEKAEVIDLMSALEASLRDRKGGGRARRAKTSTGLDELSKSELYEKAQEAGIEGRSQMSKDELIDALRESA